MKVLQVLSYFLPHQTAGTEVYTYALSKNLKLLGVDVSVIIPNYGKNTTDQYEYDSIIVHQYPEPSLVDRALIMGKRKPDGLKSFIDLLLEQKPDILHFHELAGSNGISINHVKAAKELGFKVVMTFHLAGYTCMTGTLVYKGKKLCDGEIKKMTCSKCYLHYKRYELISSFLPTISSLINYSGIDTLSWQNKLGTALGTIQLIDQKKLLFQNLVNNCDSLVVLTQWYKKILVLNGVDPAKITYIPQALPYPSYCDKSKFYIKNDLPLRLMFLGRISPFKGLHLLLDAIKEFNKNQIILDIYGQTNDDAYENQCRGLSKGKSNIRWMGILPNDKVISTMQTYDALCLCSTFSEMSPLVIQEAFAAGIPIIASHVYGNAEQIQHGVNGLLFKFNDVESLREQIQLCIDNPNLIRQMEQNIKPPADFSEVASAYYQLYQNLLYD
ncbi:MAG: glycosyltransferase [Bacteroidetes bacterium]|nr:glycosyltransferase [Bacteroidota bacterium]